MADSTSTKQHRYQIQGLARCLGLLAFLVAFISFGLRAKTGLHLIEFVDETEKFVAAQMLNTGQHLYSDIFAHHGPILYVFAQSYTQFVSQSDFSLIRLIVIFLAISSGVSVAFSPILNGFAARTLAFALYLMLLSSVWILQGLHMLLYYQIGGFFCVVILAQMVLPALLGKKMSNIGLICSGCSLMIMCFSAYSFAPTAALLIISTFLSLQARHENLSWYRKILLSGLFFAAFIIIVWLMRFGDVLGYLIYHFYFNQVIYAPFISFTSLALFNNFNLSLAPDNIIKTLAVVLLLIWSGVLAFITFNQTESNQNTGLKWLALLCLFIAVLFMNPRGVSGFQNAGFVVCNFAAIALMLASCLKSHSITSWLAPMPPLACMVLLIVLTEQVRMYALSSPGGVRLKELSRFVVDMKPEQSRTYDLLRLITPKESKILALPFNPQVYIKADRLPASGHYYYLPWQAAYNQASLLGYKIDLCKDIVTNRPTVIWFDNWSVWGKYTIDQYEPCVFKLIKENYVQINGDNPFHVRSDITLELKLLNP